MPRRTVRDDGAGADRPVPGMPPEAAEDRGERLRRVRAAVHAPLAGPLRPGERERGVPRLDPRSPQSRRPEGFRCDVRACALGGPLSRQRIHPAPFAVAVDGSILANVNGNAGETDLKALLRRAFDDDRQIFIGTRLEADEARELVSRLQDPFHEMIGYTLGARERRRLNATRKRAR